MREASVIEPTKKTMLYITCLRHSVNQAATAHLRAVTEVYLSAKEGITARNVGSANIFKNMSAELRLTFHNQRRPYNAR